MLNLWGLKMMAEPHKSISQNESGRTLMELVVVLAIMGFLSLAFIRGYVWAMDMYHASETMNEMEVRATTLATLLGRSEWPINQPVELQEFGDTTNHGYPITMTTYNDGMFVFAVRNVPLKVCEKILRDWRMVEWLMVDSNGNDRFGPIPGAAGSEDNYFDFSNPDHDLCSKFVSADSDDDNSGTVEMFFWFHRELDLCQGDDCGTTPDAGTSDQDDGSISSDQNDSTSGSNV